MDRAEAIAFLRRLRYKPNWKINVSYATPRLGFGSGDPLVLDLQLTDVPDAVNPDERVSVTGIAAVDLGRCRTELDLARSLLDQLIEVEVHEAREFLRTPDGVAPFNPHTERGQVAWAQTRRGRRWAA